MDSVEKTVISNVSPEDISKMFDVVGVSSDQVITSTPQETPTDALEGTSFTKPIDNDFSDFDNFVKSSEKDVVTDTIIDIVEPSNSVERTEPVVEKKQNDFELIAGTFDELIKDGVLTGFDDDEPIKSKKDLKSLIEGNKELAREQGKEEGIKEFIESLPRELHLAAEYAMKGGKDMKTFFKAMASFEEVKTLDIDSEAGQENIVRMSLERQGFSEDEIESEVFDLKDSGKLEAKAKMYKPKLDAAVEKEVNAKIKEQEDLQARREEGERLYKVNVYEAIKDGELSGLKVDKKMQNFLFNGLANNQFTSITGGTTNLLGALLEKIQFIEPNYKLLAEATWLLSDPEGYHKERAKVATESVTSDTIRKIKASNEATKTGLHDVNDTSDELKPKIKRSGFFKSL